MPTWKRRGESRGQMRMSRLGSRVLFALAHPSMRSVVLTLPDTGHWTVQSPGRASALAQLHLRSGRRLRCSGSQMAGQH